MAAVLVVDDDDIIRMLTRSMVRETGAKVYTADNGLAAVNHIKSGEDIDVVLMDMMMPVMDGFEATRIIKKLNSNISVIALTSLTLDLHLKKMRESGCDKILNKPVRPEVLRKALEEVRNGNDEGPDTTGDEL